MNSVKVSGKKAPLLQTTVGNEESKDEDILENVKFVYSSVITHLPQEQFNVKSVYIKYTMGKPLRIM
jgi:ribosomal protein L1